MSDIAAQLDARTIADLDRASERASATFGRLIAQSPESPVVYVIQAGSAGPLKIGRVGRVDGLTRRLGGLQTGCSETLLLRRLLPTSSPREMEQVLHEWFAPCRMQGEWFEPGPHVVRFAGGRG